MRVSRITLRNILGHEELELNELGAFTLIEGLNGQGKTSVMEAIRAITAGGHDATLLRNGAEEGEIVMVLGDDTEIRKRVTEKGSSTTVRRPDMGNVSAAQTFIRTLIDELNPIDFLNERDELKRTQYFLEALPLQLDPEEVKKALGDTIELTPADLVGHPLQVLEKLHKRVYDERTGVNRVGREKKSSIDQLSEGLQEIPAGDPTEEIAALEREREELPADVQARKDALEEESGIAVAEVQAPYLEKIGKLEARLAEVRAEMTAKTKEIDEKTAAAVAELETAERVRIAEIKGRLETLRAGEKARTAAESTRKVVDGFKAEVTELAEKSRALTQALAQLDALKLGILTKVPIKGVTIQEGILHKDGVPWPRVNRAEQVKVAISLAQLRKKEVPLVCVDNIECLDGPTLKAFRANAVKSGLQFIVTKVKQNPNDREPGLLVTSDQPEEEAVPA